MSAAIAGIAHAQAPGEPPRAGVRDPALQGPIEGLRRQIDPNASDPFQADRDAEDDRESRRRRERGRALSGDRRSVADPERALPRDSEARQERSGERTGLNVRLPGDRDEERDGDRRGDPGERSRQQRGDQQLPREPDARDAADDASDDVNTALRERRRTSPYDAIGIRVGSFLLFPEITTEVVFTDNALQSPTNARSDYGLALAPSLAIRSDWSRHSLEATFSATRSFFEDFSSQDDETYSAVLQGQLDVTRRTALVLDASYLADKEEISATDTPAGAAERTPFTVESLALEIRHRFNRLTASLRGLLSTEDYEDVALLGGGTANNDDRDLTERELTARLSYELRPGVAAFLEGSGNEREFDQRIDDNGNISGSRGYQGLAGLSFELTGKLYGEIAAGYARQTPDEPRLEDVTGLIFNAGLEWRATPLTTFRFDASSEINETTQVDTAGSLVRQAEISVEHAFRENIIGGISLGYSLEEFETTGQEDRDYAVGVTGEYLLTRSAALTGAYEFTKSTSSVPGSDYVENEFRVGFRLRR